MLACVIKGPTFEKAKEQIEKALKYADALEFRWDYFEEIAIDKIKALIKDIDVAVIFTLRKKSQGGAFDQEEEKRLSIIEDLLQTEPDYIDLEFDVPTRFLESVRDNYPKVQIIISYHNFTETPQDLEALFKEIQKPILVHYKIATTAQSSIDLLRMMHFIKKKQKEVLITGITMGECGEPMRVLGKVLGNAFDYASCEKEDTQLHQVDLKTLHNIYHYLHLNKDTRMYALLGDPVDKSKGHIFHNDYFQRHKMNAVYVKLKVTKEELPSFFKELTDLAFDGFSVTMPLKETVMKELDHVDSDAGRIGAVNTLVRREDIWFGFNTDAPAALDAAEEKGSVRGKKVVILGAGGAARAIAYEALKRGASVFILNRTEEKAKLLAESLGCQGYGMDKMSQVAKEGYDVLINTTSVGMDSDELPLEKEYILPNTVVMDAIYNPMNTPLLIYSKDIAKDLVFGFEMFERQAVLQQTLWDQRP